MGLFLNVLEMHVGGKKKKEKKIVLKKPNFDSVLGSQILTGFWE